MAAGMAVLGVAVSVSAWAARAEPARSSKAGHTTPMMMMGGANSGLSG